MSTSSPSSFWSGLCFLTGSTVLCLGLVWAFATSLAEESAFAKPLDRQILHAAPLPGSPSSPARPDTTEPDTTEPDTTEPDPSAPQAPARTVVVPDTTEPDSLLPSQAQPVADTAASTVVLPDTGRVGTYVPSQRRQRGSRLFPQRSSPFLGPRSPSGADAITLDSAGTSYRVDDGGETMRVRPRSYRRARYDANLTDNWATLAEQRRNQRNQRGGLGVNIVVPGGRQSAFSTIFGKPQVDLRINGQADISAGFDYRKSEAQIRLDGDGGQLDPDFKQDLRLGITGTIGDKMQIDVDWDTNNQFEYQNQVKLQYTGYEDEIVQSVEAGNVFLETPSQFISGGQSLFGIKSAFQFGNLSLTTIASQQEGQSNSLTIEGGSEKTEFSLRPTDYDDNTHYFLGYFFRNNWNAAHSDPTILQTPINRVRTLEVWKLRTQQGTNEPNIRRAVAVVDLGESERLLVDGGDYREGTVLPGEASDQYDEADLENLRDGNIAVSDYLQSAGTTDEPLDDQDFVDGEFKRLEAGRDYVIDERLGYISLRQRLRADEALAVAYRYQDNAGNTLQVGDFSSENIAGTDGGVNSDRLVLKLLRTNNPIAPQTSGTLPAAWFLELRNIYRLGGRGFSPDNFQLDISYQPPGETPRNAITEVTGSTTLLQTLGLDRLNQDGAPTPDQRVDFSPLVLDASEGLVIFPYLQPFGERVLDAAADNSTRDAGDDFAFTDLYVKKKTNADQENTGENVYRILGEYTGGTQEFYDLRAFAGVVEGSVRVTAGGQELQEGTDYVVDYQGGTVTITNQTYLAAGRDISIDYEQNSFANLQQKTLLGARADWAMDDKYALGGTVLRLSERSPVDKYRIGEEPVRNLIWGLDGSLDLEPRWLTRAMDGLPLIQTKERSRLSVSGEFAQLRPGHTQSQAYEDALESVRADTIDTFAEDERNGTSFIDDFEGFENSFSLRQQLAAWRISAPPAAINDETGVLDTLNTDRPGSQDDLERSYWRGTFAWYQLSNNVLDQVEDDAAEQRGDARAIDILRTRDLFPDRDVANDLNQVLRPLDLYFSPWERGPYNYSPTLDEFATTPKKVWGGFTQRLPEGYTDFSLQNVEFIEMIVKVFPEPTDGGAPPAGANASGVTPGAKLYVDLGSISEDVIPNGTANDEDGLSNTFNIADTDGLSRLANGPQNDVLDIRGRKTEDLGLDGLVSYTTPSGPDGYAGGAFETEFYADFIADAEAALGRLPNGPARTRLAADVAKIRLDPSGDDYYFFGDRSFFNNTEFFGGRTATVQQRFSRYYSADELNGIESQSELSERATARRGISRQPDTEDLDGVGGSVETVNDYYQYEVPLDRLQEQSQVDGEPPADFVVSELNSDGDDENARRGWYKIRIPVRDFTRKQGSINEFTRIRAIRMWTTGHEAPVTLRLASLELVGSQWRTSEAVKTQNAPPEEGGDPDNEGDDLVSPGEGVLRVASINNEEDAVYEKPAGAFVSRTRSTQGGTQRAREQSLLLNVDQLMPGQQRAVFKAYQQLNLLKYSNVRMYVHAEGPARQDIRENLRVFVRFGSNESSDYYEYEKALANVSTPGDRVNLWPEGNEVKLQLSELNQLKVARDQSEGDVQTVFSRPSEFDPRAQLSIRGRPSLSSVNSVVIGLRHVDEETSTASRLENVEVWVNELRVTGYDERSAWAAQSSAQIDLADVASLQGSFQQQTDGFGGLQSTLEQRQQSDQRSWNVRGDLNLNKLLPERQNWQIPVTVQLQQSRTQPRFDPNRGDVRVEEVVQQLSNESLDDLESRFGEDYDVEGDALRRTLIDSVRTAAETFSRRRSMTVSLSKSDSESWLLRQTVDATQLDFSYFDRSARSPSQRFDDQWNWSSALDYRLGFGRPRTVKPLWFLQNVPLIGGVGDVEFNYVPQSLSFNANFQRDFRQGQSRSTALRAPTLPNDVANPVRSEQQFTHRRGFGLQYNPFEFLNLTFGTTTSQSLNDAGSTTQSIVRAFGTIAISAPDSNGVADSLQFDDRLTGRTADEIVRTPSLLSAELAGSDVVLDTTALRGILFEQQDLNLRSEGAVFRDLLLGDASPRTNTYGQRFSATLRPGFTDRDWLDWIDLQDVVYQSDFSWQNGAEGRVTGANASNRVDVRTGVSLKPANVWQRFGFFQRLKEAEQKSQAEDRAEQQERRREREERRRERAEERERQREAERASAAGDTTAAAPEALANAEESEAEDEEDPDLEEEADEDDEEEEDDKPSFSDLPLPDVTGLLRQTALMFLDIRDISVNYTGGRQASNSNIGVPTFGDNGALQDAAVDYSLFDALSGRGPSLGYRFGLSRSISPASQRILGDNLQVQDALQNSNRLEGRTTLSPSQALSISLNWDVQWSSRETVTFRRVDPEEALDDVRRTTTGVPFDSFSDESGQNTASVWAFGSYRRVFEAQLETLDGLINGPRENLQAGDVPLTNASLSRDFQAGLLSGPGSVDGRGFLPFPMPGWRVTYSGLSDLPLIRSVTRQVTVEHAYNASYTTQYATLVNPDNQPSVAIGGSAFPYTRSEFEVSAAQITERLSPLLGINLSWRGNVETSVQWNREMSTYLRTASLVVEESDRSELTVRLNYTKTGLDIPLLPLGRLNNRVTLELNLSRTFESEREFNIRTALEQAGQDPEFDPADALRGDNVSIQRDVGRFRVSPRVGYQFSNRVNADLLVEYERFNGDNREPSYTTINGGFNVRISISER